MSRGLLRSLLRVVEIENSSLFIGALPVTSGNVGKNNKVILKRYSSGEAASQQNENVGGKEYEKDHQHKRRNEKWWNVGTDWKIAASIIAAVSSYYITSRLDRIKLKKQMRLDIVESQIRRLYGPLYGNRLVSQTSYRAVMKHHDSLEKYLQEARINRDADMIRRWRSYVLDVLYPLDKAAVDMIVNNAHLVAHGGFPEEFEDLLIHTARMEFVMQHWKTDNGKLESASDFTDDDFLESNNSSGMRGRSRALAYAKEKYEELRKEQRELSLEIGDYQQTDGVILSLARRFLR